MSKSLNPQELLAAIPGWKAGDVHIEQLPGGLTNRSYKVSRGGDSFVLRLDADHTAALGLDRRRERRILNVAADAGLAPDIVYADEEGGVLVTRYVDGQAWTIRDLADPGHIDQATEMLREVHALPLAESRFDGEAIAAGYLVNLGSQADDASVTQFAERCVAIITETPRPDILCCCHNDVVAENLVGQPRPMLIDWEYACDNDPLFDVASLIAYHDLGQRVSDAWLEAYVGEVLPEHRERLRQLCRLYDALHWLWIAARCSISQSELQHRRMERLRQRIESRPAG